MLPGDRVRFKPDVMDDDLPDFCLGGLTGTILKVRCDMVITIELDEESQKKLPRERLLAIGADIDDEMYALPEELELIE